MKLEEDRRNDSSVRLITDIHPHATVVPLLALEEKLDVIPENVWSSTYVGCRVEIYIFEYGQTNAT